MKLRDAQVTNFRSVEDSGTFGLERVACLVGKNEAGKTAILQALTGLNPHRSTPATFDLERDYPRAQLAQYAKRHPKEAAVVISTNWEPTAEELATIRQQFGPEALVRAEVKVFRRYGDSEPNWEIPINLAACSKFLIGTANLTAEEAAPLSQANNTQTLRSALQGIENRTESQEQLLTVVGQLEGGSITNAIKAHLTLPQFMYFSYYDRMKGQIRLDTLQAREEGSAQPPIEPGDRVFLDFLDLAGISPEEIAAATTYEGRQHHHSESWLRGRWLWPRPLRRAFCCDGRRDRFRIPRHLRFRRVRLLEKSGGSDVPIEVRLCRKAPRSITRDLTPYVRF